MKNCRNVVWMATLFSVLTIFACVTINIYFPAEKVESVAGEIVDEIRGPGEGNKPEPSKNDQESFLHRSLMALSSSCAWADEVMSVSNPTIRALKQRMKTRYAQMKPFYGKGMVQERDNGYVSVGDTGSLGLKEKRNLKNLVAAENKDRKSLYEEIAKALKIDLSQINKIEKIFAKEWQKSVR